MSDAMTFSLVTRDRKVLEDRVTSVTIPAWNGELQALPLHTPYLAKLGIGVLTCRLAGGDTRQVVVTGGFVEILPDAVTAMVRTAEFPEEIDAERAKQAKERAEKRLQHPDPDTDVERAAVALARAVARLNVASGS